MQGLKAVWIGIVCLALSACAATYDNHGYAPSDEDLEQIIVGVDTRDSVIDLVGRPGAAGVLNDSGYYYVKSRRRNFAYRAPQEIDRQVVAISFDQAGVVTNIERFGIERGRVITLSRRVTDSNTQGVSFIRQLLGNLGNFNPAEFLE